MSKKIGIPGWSTGENSWGITKPYGEFIRKFGQCIILFPDEPVRNDLDLLFLPGGMDINPTTLNSDFSLYTGNSNPSLEYFDTYKLPEYIKNGVPVFGVCRGAQRLWSMYGGELIQHNPYHQQSEYPKEECHTLKLVAEYSNLYSKSVNKVNSRHHQSMSIVNTYPDALEVIAFAKENDKYIRKDIVEIFKHKTLNIYGVQYHPEDCPTEKISSIIISDLLYPIKEENLV